MSACMSGSSAVTALQCKDEWQCLEKTSTLHCHIASTCLRPAFACIQENLISDSMHAPAHACTAFKQPLMLASR